MTHMTCNNCEVFCTNRKEAISLLIVLCVQIKANQISIKIFHKVYQSCKHYSNFLLQKLSDLSLKMLEKVLLRAFLMVYASDFDGDDDRHPYQSGKSKSAQKRAFTLLSSVCWHWLQTVSIWPQSPAGHWLKKLIERKFAYFLTTNMYIYI